MREILFRGRDTHGVWQYGDYIRYDDEMCNITDTTIYRHAHLCNTETVGQYTGLTDKNGTKIFEGDIVRITDEHESIYDCNCGVGDIQFKYGHWYVLGKPQNSLWDLCDCYYCEVIGNIHDNPELLKNGQGA